MDFAFSEKELAFAAEARAWLEANVPAAWRRDHCWSRADDPASASIPQEFRRESRRPMRLADQPHEGSNHEEIRVSRLENPERLLRVKKTQDSISGASRERSVTPTRSP